MPICLAQDDRCRSNDLLIIVRSFQRTEVDQAGAPERELMGKIRLFVGAEELLEILRIAHVQNQRRGGRSFCDLMRAAANAELEARENNRATPSYVILRVRPKDLAPMAARSFAMTLRMTCPRIGVSHGLFSIWNSAKLA